MAKGERGRIYQSIVERVFQSNYTRGATEVPFTRDQVASVARALDLNPKNVGDLIYSFRYRRPLPDSISRKAPPNHVWIIRGGGTGKYRFCAIREELAFIQPRSGLAETKIPDATPGVIAKYALDDEQALLAKVRYNRLIDVFTGVTCYSLQNHLRTQVRSIGQIETDEIYIGVDKHGAHYAIPVQAKGGRDKHSIVQIEQDFELCEAKFPRAICLPIAAQFIGTDKIALFSFRKAENGDALILAERHYVLVPPNEISEHELVAYRKAASSS